MNPLKVPVDFLDEKLKEFGAKLKKEVEIAVLTEIVECLKARLEVLSK